MCPLSCPEVESGSELEVLWERLYSMDKVKLFLDPQAGGRGGFNGGELSRSSVCLLRGAKWVLGCG